MWILKSVLASNNLHYRCFLWGFWVKDKSLDKMSFSWVSVVWGGNFKHIFKWSNHHFVMAVSHDLESTYLASF